MMYLGGKQRISKPLSEFLNSKLKEGQPFVDAFCGSCNIISKIDGNRTRIADDKHQYLIAMWKGLQKGWTPPTKVTKEDYQYTRYNRDEDKILSGFLGFGMSFGGGWFAGFTGEVSKQGQNYLKCATNGINKKMLGLNCVSFYNLDYNELLLPDSALIYCDIPYNKKEVGVFDHEVFYIWCKSMIQKGHTVYVSEYEHNVPEGAHIVWSKTSGTTHAAWEGHAKKTTEVLFTWWK